MITTNNNFLGATATFIIALALIYWGYRQLKKGNMFWAIVLIALGITTIGGIYIKIG